MLSPNLRRISTTRLALALAILLVHLADLFWLVAPPFRQAGISIHWLDAAAPIGIGGMGLAAFAWLLGRRPLLPLHDPRDTRLQEAIEHG